MQSPKPARSVAPSSALHRIGWQLSRLFRRGAQETVWSGSGPYWEDRYRSGGNSGVGSTGEFAAVKAQVVNDFVRDNQIRTIVEFGCGDGSQLALAEYPTYVGLDVSETALSQSSHRFSGDSTKSFFLYRPSLFIDRQRVFHADLALSLEVIFHLIEDDIYDLYMQHLFGAADRFVLICSTDIDLEVGVPQRRHRQFSDWVADHAPEWERVQVVENPLSDWGDSVLGARQDFFVYAPR